MSDPLPPTIPLIAKTVGVTLLASDMTFVKDVRIPYPTRGYPDVIRFEKRVFGRERVRDPHGVRRWHYVEVTCAEALAE